jgi:glutathione S-transferase
MTDPIVLHDFPTGPAAEGWESFSPFVLQVARALKLAKLPFEQRPVNMLKLKKLNPKGQLPVVTFQGENLPESAHILQRIETLNPGSMTAGLDARGIAEAWLWKEFADTALYPFVLATRWADERGWVVVRERFFASAPALLRPLVAPSVRKGVLKMLRERDFLRSGLPALYVRMGRVLDDLDTRAPDAGFWLGANASIADLALFSHLHSLRLPLTPWQAEVVAKRARLSRYLDRVDAATRG